MIIEVNKAHKKAKLKTGVATTLKVAVAGAIISVVVYSGARALKKNVNVDEETINNVSHSINDDNIVEANYNEESDNYTVKGKDSNWEVPTLVGLCAALGTYSIYYKNKYEDLKEKTINRSKESDIESYTFNFDYSNSISSKKHR